MNGAAEMNEAGGWRWCEVVWRGVAGGGLVSGGDAAGKRRGSGGEAREIIPRFARGRSAAAAAQKAIPPGAWSGSSIKLGVILQLDNRLDDIPRSATDCRPGK